MSTSSSDTFGVKRAAAAVAAVPAEEGLTGMQNYWDTETQLDLKSMVDFSKEIVSIKEQLASMDQRFTSMDQRFTQRFTSMDEKFTDLDTQFKVLSSTVDAIHHLLHDQMAFKADKSDVATVDTKVNDLGTRVGGIEDQLQALHKSQTGFFTWVKAKMTSNSN